MYNDLIKKGDNPMDERVKSSDHKKDVVQVRNPRTGHYVKIDREAGKIIANKISSGPFKGVPIARRRKTG